MRIINDLYVLLMLYPEKRWSYPAISCNAFLPMSIVLDRPGKNWNWDWMSDNPNITPEVIRAFSYKFWNWEKLSVNPGITREIIMEHMNKYWDWQALGVTRDTIATNPITKYTFNNMHAMSRWGTSPSPDKIITNTGMPWTWEDVASNPNITDSLVEEHLDAPWDWRLLSWNNNITCKFIKEHPNIPWDWNALSHKFNLTLEFIEENLDAPWNWSQVSHSDVITLTFIHKHSNAPWDWGGFGFRRMHLCVASASTTWIIYKFISKIRLSIARRKRAFKQCMFDLVMKPNIGIEFFKLAAELDEMNASC